MLSGLDKDRIEEAVRAAEAGTRGEIVVVLASEVSHYPEVPIAWGAAVALAGPPLALALGLSPLAAAGAAGVWLVAQASAVESEIALALGAYTVLQLALFVVVAALVSLAPLRRALTPAVLKRHRVARAAAHHFAAIGAHGGAAQAGVLIFVAVDDRKVQILADPTLHAAAGEAAWKRAAAAVAAGMKGGADPTAGILEAVALCGQVLAAHVSGERPPDPTRGDHPDRLVEV